MIDEKEFKEKFGSSEIVPFVRETFPDISKYFKNFHKHIDVVEYIESMDIDGFEKSVERFVKKNPDAKVKATGFVFSTKNPEKNKKYTFEKD